MNIRFRLALAAAVAALVAAFSQPTMAQPKPIKIGVLSANSGAVAGLGIGLQQGIKMAVDEINAAGGIHGRKIEVVVRDEQMKPDVSVAAAKELISSEKVDVLMGPMASNDALAVSEVAKEARILNFSPTASSDELTDEKFHKYFFQLSSTSDVDAKRFVSIMKKIGSKKICFIGFDYAYSTDVFKNIRKLLPSDMQESREYLLKLGTSDFNTLISQVMADPCDTVMNMFFSGGFIALAKQAEPFGLFKAKKVVSGGNNGDYAVAEALKDKFPEGLWSFSNDLWYVDYSPELKKFHDGLAKVAGKKETLAFGLYGYMSVQFVAEAIRKTGGNTNSDALVTALEGLTVNTPMGPLTVDPKNHRISKPAFYGPIVTVPGSDIKRMSPAELLR
jgi:ABC-type branched-subunit amino acid transport system substrate-binding protein